MFIKAEPIDKTEGKKTEKGLGGASCTLPQLSGNEEAKVYAAACFPSGIFVPAGENFLLYWCPMYILIAEVMVMEERKAKILINRAGGNAGAQSKGYRVALPSAWMKSLGITENDREVLLQFGGECITLRRPGPSGYEAFLREARRQGHELLRLHYYDGDTLCTKICADKVTRCLAVENLVDDSLSTAFGVNTSPTWEDLENFLEERCVPRQRDGLRYYLQELGLEHYDPLAIVRKTQGRMAEDNCWLDIVEG